MIKKLLKAVRRRIHLAHQQNVSTGIKDVQREMTLKTPDNVAVKGWASFSQCDEDGIIQACLDRVSEICELSGTFIEVGCGNGLENNTHHLLLNGYKGCWIDGDPANIASIRKALPLDGQQQLLVLQQFLTQESMTKIMKECVLHAGTPDVDFFSLDTDGNDYLLTREALRVLRPKIICVEYNAKFPPPLDLKIEYSSIHQWDESDYFGATLQAWVNLLEGYQLVSCNASGVNAFFVRSDLTEPFKIYAVGDLYQPARYWLVGSRGHHPSMKWLRDSLRMPTSAQLGVEKK